jgi:hypothetical protein
MKVIANILVIELINKANVTMTSAHQMAVEAADMASESYKGKEKGAERNTAIRKLYQPTLDGKNGAVRDAFYNRLVILCFPKQTVEVPLSKVELKAIKAKSPKSTVTTKTVKATEVFGKDKLSSAAKQVRENAGIAKKQPNKGANVSSIAVSMPKFIADLSVVLKGKDTLAQFKAALNASGFNLTAIRVTKITSKLADQIQGNPALLAKLENGKVGGAKHIAQG